MKFTTYKRKSKLLSNRLTVIATSSKTLSELPSLTTKDKEKALTLFEETKDKSKEYDTIRDDLLSTSKSVEPDEEPELEHIDASLSELISDILSTLRPILPQAQNEDILNVSQASTDSQNATSNVRLPKIQLKTFAGDVSQWVAFYNIFDVTVHQNQSLSNIEKFQYLLSCLHKEPFNLVKSLPLSSENYTIAYNTLLKRYHNPRILKSLHINHLIDMPPCHETNAKHLRDFVSQFREHSSALSSLDVNVNEDNPVLITLLLRKFDLDVRTRFESKRRDSENLPTPDEFINFLEEECCHMENAVLTTNQSTTVRHSAQTASASYFKPKAFQVKHKNVTLTTHRAQSTCSYCNNDHIVYSCPEFLKLTPQARYEFIKSHDLCVNCLGTHKFKDCVSKRTCKHCSKKHHSFLHLGPVLGENKSKQKSVHDYKSENKAIPPGNTKSADGPSSEETVHAVRDKVNNESFTTLLGTTLVKLNTPAGNSMVVRALIDSASSCSLVNSDIVNKLQLKRQFSTNARTINGISATSVHVKGTTHADIFTLGNQVVSKQHPLVVLDKITSDMPMARISSQVKGKLCNFKLADPNFDKQGPIQLLIGADLFMDIIKESKFSLGDNMPYALDTIFGYVVIGKTPVLHINQTALTANLTTLVCSLEDPLHKLMSNFWALEKPPEQGKLTKDELMCEKHFLDTHTRSSETGKFTVRLPFKDDPTTLGDSSVIAKRRFLSLENKLNTQPEFKKLYVNFMAEYENAGHMTVFNDDLTNKGHYFLPHHGVYKESSSTTRLRVVFDASCKTSTHVSLNDILHVGPKLLTDIATVITHFRHHQFVFTTDVKQMFRSIELDPRDRNFQLIYWRTNNHEPLSVYQLNTVTYGMASSPYLSNRVLQQLIEEESDTFPNACNALKNHIYVDDVVLGADTLEDAITLQNDVIKVLNKGGFQLRKWSANHNKLLTGIPSEFHEQPVKFRTPEQPLIGILGLQWIPSTDNFTYQITLTDLANPTKRTVLSEISKIFDPCGFLAPVVVLAKRFIQTLWIKGLEWDTPLPADLAEKWFMFYKELTLLDQITIPRFIRISDVTQTQLLGFCDSSESAYGACLYLRTSNSSGQVQIALVSAKTKVAPLKRVSLPRLELCAAHLLAQMINHFLSTFSNQMQIDSIYAWTDSTVTLSWISTPSYKLKTFVGNRVAQIQEWLPTTIWNHVESASNPADCASRGVLPHELINHTLWWSGPPWLTQDPSTWPKNSHHTQEVSEIPELKPSTENIFTSTLTECDLLTRFSSWNKLRSVIAIILRFKHNSSNPDTKLRGKLTSNEIRNAESTICRMVQANAFADDILALNKNKPCSAAIQQLSPFIDEHGLIRVGGRLRNANISADAKHPILLPKSHFVTALIIDYYHENYLHAGPQFLQAHISKRFWILSARSVIRSRIHKCFTCFRFKPRTVNPKMGDLPKARVNPAPCFLKTGLDYGGPFEIKIHTLRNAKTVKAYLCLFVCFATKAIHIEIASDLSTDAFIAALNRFISRRGSPSDLYMDNATNFVGASNKIHKIVRSILRDETTKNKLHDITVQQNIKFHFIPPSAPHHGGLWESGIKSAKHLLKRVIGERTLTLEEIQTLSVRVESILNSRPLCPLSNDPSELEFLSPGHFLIGRPMTSLPEQHYNEDMPLNRLKRWQAIQAMVQRLWKRWQSEYLHTLQQKRKWTKDCPNMSIGDLVLIHENTTPPQTWPVGRVIATHPGADGITRVVTLNTARGQLKRPVVKLSPFPQ